MENEVEQVINEIDSEVSKINEGKYRFRLTGPLSSAISREQRSVERNRDLLNTFRRYASEESNPLIKGRYERDAQRYERRLAEASAKMQQNSQKLGEIRDELTGISQLKTELLKERDPLKIIANLEQLIAKMKNLGINTSKLEELLMKLMAMMDQPFTIILEYAVSE